MIIKLIILVFLFSLSAIFKAIADVLKDHFLSSIFKNKDQNFWNPDKSWDHGFFFGKYHGDAWHISMSAMILSFFLACLDAALIGITFVWFYYLIAFIVLSIWWIIVFNTFYNHVLHSD